MDVLLDDELLELQRIIAEGLLTPVFQPIIDFRVRALLGYEALIRKVARCNSPINFLPLPGGMRCPRHWSMPVVKPVCGRLQRRSWPGVSSSTSRRAACLMKK